MNRIDAGAAFVFANSFEMVLTFFLGCVVAFVLYEQTNGYRDLIDKLRRMTRLDFQGGWYDILIALLVLVIGMFLRAESTWEWRSMELPLAVDRLSLGLFLKGVAVFCLIRILMPTRRFNQIASLILVVSIAFGIANVWL